MATNPQTLVKQAATQVRNALTQLGFAYQLTDGTLWEVSYKSLEYVEDTYGLLEINTQSLPRRVHIEQLTSPGTLHHLTAVVGYPVKRLNTTGLTYCVVFKNKPQVKLPAHATLDLSLRPKGLVVPIGLGRDGHVWLELVHAGHMLVGGSTRSGKSNWLNALLASLLAGHTPQEIQLALIDPKGVEFVTWGRAPHLIASIASDPDSATAVLEQVEETVLQRQTLFAQGGVKSLAAYNRTASAPLPYLVVVVDEFTDLALLAGLKSPFYNALTRLVSKGAAFGVLAVLATQNPKAEVINTLIRANLTTRIAFRCAEADQSRIILGAPLAHQLPPIPGRAIAQIGSQLTEVQTYYLSEADARALADQLAGVDRSKPLISELEARLARYALSQLDGSFTINKLAQAFDRAETPDGGPRITRWTIQKTGEKLEKQGLLTNPNGVTNARQVSPQLGDLAKKSPGNV